MTANRLAARLVACLFAFALSPINLAEPQAEANADEQTLDHIRLLEKMLRDAGVDPPARPDALAEHVDRGLQPIVPPSFATVVLDTEVAAINARGEKSANAIKHVRRWLGRDDVKRRVAAQDVIDAITKWTELEMKAIEAEPDRVWAYIQADDALSLLGQDPLVKPFKRFIHTLQKDRATWRHIESMAAYRRALMRAEAVGLLGDWASIDFQNTNVSNTIKAVTAKLTLIAKNWPNSEAARAAETKLKDWSKREKQAVANLPAWRYTWQLDLIQIGTEEKTTVVTDTDGTIHIREDLQEVYDPNNVMLYGTFQNTADKPYRYTFLVGVTSDASPNTPFAKLSKKQLVGYELVQTPLLKPGQLYRWETVLAVKSIRNIRRGGIGKVEVHEPR